MIPSPKKRHEGGEMARHRGRRGQENWRIWAKLLKLAVLLGLFAVACIWAYETGHTLGLRNVAERDEQIQTLTAADAQKTQELTRLQSELQTVKTRADELQTKYQQVAPSEEVVRLMGLLKKKLDSGLDSKRLVFVLENAEPPKKCGGEETRRFIVKTPKFNGSATWVRFADVITVTAEGIGANNNTEQWFDVEKPLTATFTVIGGKEAQVSGPLPLHYSVVVKNYEHRFTIAPGARGFVDVTSDRCEYHG